MWDFVAIPDFWREKVSKEYLPWYAPIPLSPTPPKGKASNVEWMIASLAQIEPLDVSFMNLKKS